MKLSEQVGILCSVYFKLLISEWAYGLLNVFTYLFLYFEFTFLWLHNQGQVLQMCHAGVATKSAATQCQPSSKMSKNK